MLSNRSIVLFNSRKKLQAAGVSKIALDLGRDSSLPQKKFKAEKKQRSANMEPEVRWRRAEVKARSNVQKLQNTKPEVRISRSTAQLRRKKGRKTR